MPAHDLTTVRQRLEAARKNLLDTSLRNRLINYRTPKARGAEVVGEAPAEVFRILVADGKPMTFIGKPDKDKQGNQGELLQRDAIDSPPAIEDREKPVVDVTEVIDTADSKLNTNDTANALASRLLKTWRDAQSSIEEQGVNILFLALGMLEWYEADASQELIKSPLILIPVLMERTRGNKFQIKYEGTEIGENLSLAAKLAQEFRIKIPNLPDTDDLDVKAYMGKVAEAVSFQKRWRVNDKAIVLGFFSYAKYLMFKDLEGNHWPEQSKPWAHPVLGALLDAGFNDDDSGISENEDLDRHRPVDKVHEVVDADSSQILALLEARSGRSLIIEGPPGTGKSQTITNLIAEAIGEGKKVLFVAEKRAALEVVWRNLERARLHEACLELHSNKTHKKTFYAQIKETMDLGMPQINRREEELYKLTETRDKLNVYCEAVHQVIPGRDIIPIQAIGRLVSLGQEQEGLRKPDFSIMKGWSYADFNRRLDLVDRIQNKVKETGVPAGNLFFDSHLDLLLPDDKITLNGLIKAAVEKVTKAQESVQMLASRLSLTAPENLSDAYMICRAAEKAVNAPPLEGVSVSLETWNRNATVLRATLLSGKKFSELRQNLQATLKPDAWNTDVRADRQVLCRLGDKWWRFFARDYWKTHKKLIGFCQVKLLKRNSERLSLLDAILEFQTNLQNIQQNQSLCREFFASQWRGEVSEWAHLLTILDWILELHREVGERRIPKGLLNFLERRYDREGLEEQASHAASNCKSAQASLESVLSFLKSGQNLQMLASASFQHQLGRLHSWLTDLSPLEDLISFNYLNNEAQSQGLQQVAQIAVDWALTRDRLVEAFQRSWYSGVLREACEQRPQLAHFDRQNHEALVETFRQLDRRMLEINQVKILLKHWQGMPKDLHSAGGSLGILQREFEKRSRHKAIRQVMGEAGEAIQAIKPVFMMSPISIAMYLPPNGPKFDLVIFDEASQIKPEDAFCAIIRANQAIVVGDSKQMPPTSFFDKMMLDEEEQEEEAEVNVTRDIESILGIMSSKLPPTSPRRRDLRWHYRSRHESLIAPSNRLFYRERLVVFPNPERKPEGMGLKFNYHPETFYDRGGSRKNRDEARIVAKAVLHHIKENPKVTLGVVAFSLSQQEAIQDELELLRAQDPALNEFDIQNPTEPLFVKNLETVQGDERDVVFISVGYGRDQDGFVSMNFGPINKEGGERRLNVLFTRARIRCEIFSNIRSQDLRLAEPQAQGVRALRTFLYFAETGELDMPAPSGRDPMSPFEETVIKELRKHGYRVEPQVGSAGFFVDIGVCDPENPDRFILGIECDGAKYHSARCARDRDRLRQFVLEQHRGWRIHRIWSTDWWRNQERELRRLLTAVEKAITTKGQKPLIAERAREVVNSITRKAPSYEGTTNLYQFCKLRISLDGTALRDVEPDRMAEWIWKVVEAESPVYFEEVVRRIREAAGMERAGDAARDAIQKGIRILKKRGQILEEKDFFWKSPKNVPVVRNRGEFPNYLKKLEFIHQEEIKAAIVEAVRKSFGISRQDAVPAALAMLGFERVTDLMFQQTEKVVQDLVFSGEIIQQGEMLKLR